MPGNGAAGASYGELLATSLLVLIAVCVAAVVAVRLAGRFLATGRGRRAHLMDVVARLPLEPRRSLYVVEVAGKTLLLGTSEMGISVLSELDAAAVRAADPGAGPVTGFGELVKAAWARRRAQPARSEPDAEPLATPREIGAREPAAEPGPKRRRDGAGDHPPAERLP